MLQLAFMFAPGHGVLWVIGILVVIIIYKRKTIGAYLFAILILPFYLPYLIGKDIAFAIKRKRKRRKWKKQRELQEKNQKTPPCYHNREE